LKPAAALEEGMNRSNQLLYDARENRRIAQQKADDDRWYDEQRTRTAETAEQTRRLNAETAQKRAAIQDYIARNRNKQFKTDDKGFILALDPLTGEGELVLDPTGNPIKSSEATDAQREQMRLNTALKVEAARTVGDVKVVEARGAQDRATEAARPVRPSSSASGATSELEKTRAIVNRANNARNKYPDLAKWIKIDGTNVSITPPSTGGIFSRGPSTAEHAKLYGEIYGPVINRSNTVGGDNAAPAGKVKVINSQGQEGYIPASQLEAALAQGYRKAQ
jgi:hypothetical protein